MDGTTTQNPLDEYLGRKKGKPFLDAARQFELNWLHTTRERGVWRLWWLIYCNVHGIDPVSGAYNSTAELQFGGTQDNYAKFRVQLARRYINQRKLMAQDQRLSFNGVATQNDVASLAEVNVSTRGIEYMLRKARLEQAAGGALESLCYYGAGGILEGWEYRAGEKVPAKEPQKKPDGSIAMRPTLDANNNPVMQPDPETGEPVMQMEPFMQDVQKPSGMPTYRWLYPWQIAMDPYMEEGHPAFVVKTAVNKYELAAKFPEKARDIIGLSIDEEMGDDALFAWGGARSVSSDTIVLRQYFERDSEAVPGGRWAGYVKDVGLWGVDDMVQCPLEQGMPVKLMVGARYHSTAYGYPESGDLLSLQTVLNEMVSALVTNAIKRGNPNAYKREDVQIDPERWVLGNNLIDLPAGAEAPVWDDPPKMDAVSQYVIEFVSEQARSMLGSNSVTEGNPTANISSGSFAVLLVNVAQKYASTAQQAHDEAATEAANDGLELAKKNAENGFWADIAGIGDAPYVSLIQQSNLKSLKRVNLVRQSPVLSTFVGREIVYDKLIALPKQDRADAAEFLLHGRLDPFVERDQAARIRIRKENEQMLQGVAPVVTIWDDHAIEGPMHRAEYDKLRTMGPPSDGPKGPPPPDGPDGPMYQRWMATSGPAYLAWQTACQLFDRHLTEHAGHLATTPPVFGIVAGWAPIAGLVSSAGPDEQQQQQQQGQEGDKPGQSGGQSQPKPPKPPKSPEPPKGAAGGMGKTV